MSTSRPHENGSQPEASRLAESLRELTEAQRQTVAAAAGLFDELIDEVRQRESPRLNVSELLGPPSAGGDGTAALGQIRASVTRTIDLYSDLVSEAFAIYADAIEQVLRDSGGVGRPASSGAGAQVVLTGAPGDEAKGKVWLHNLNGSALKGVRLWMTALSDHDGGTLPGIECVFSPAVLDVESGSSAVATVSVALPPDAAAGAYHGLVLASGVPAARVPVVLKIGLR